MCETLCLWSAIITCSRDIPVGTKHWYNICTTSAQHIRLWSAVVQMLYKCFTEDTSILLFLFSCKQRCHNRYPERQSHQAFIWNSRQAYFVIHKFISCLNIMYSWSASFVNIHTQCTNHTYNKSQSFSLYYHLDYSSPWIWKGVSATMADTPFHIQGDVLMLSINWM